MGLLRAVDSYPEGRGPFGPWLWLWARHCCMRARRAASKQEMGGVPAEVCAEAQADGHVQGAYGGGWAGGGEAAEPLPAQRVIAPRTSSRTNPSTPLTDVLVPAGFQSLAMTLAASCELVCRNGAGRRPMIATSVMSNSRTHWVRKQHQRLGNGAVADDCSFWRCPDVLGNERHLPLSGTRRSHSGAAIPSRTSGGTE